jgi:hypothetical protein
VAISVSSQMDTEAQMQLLDGDATPSPWSILEADLPFDFRLPPIVL